MSAAGIDKFGRRYHSTASGGVKRGPPGIGFTLTEDNHFDIEKRRLLNVEHPLNETDAATKHYVDNKLKEFTTTVGADIKNSKETIDDTLRQKYEIKANCLTVNPSTNNFDACHKTISKVATPENDKDAVNRKYVEEQIADINKKHDLLIDKLRRYKSESLAKSQEYTAEAIAHSLKDVTASIALINEKLLKCISLDAEHDINHYSANRRKLVKLADPTLSDDAVTRKYLTWFVESQLKPLQASIKQLEADGTDVQYTANDS